RAPRAPQPAHRPRDRERGRAPALEPGRLLRRQVRGRRQGAVVPPALARWLALAAALGVAALFPLPFWIGMGILHWNAPWQVALLAGVGLGIALLAVWVAIRL